MLLAMLTALGILLVLLADVAIRALPVLTERPLDFLTSNLSSRPARAGIAQGLAGALQLGVVVAVLSGETYHQHGMALVARTDDLF